MMIVRIRLFGQLRELAGADVLEKALPDGATVADALDELERRPPLDELLARLPVRMAVNREVATPDTLLRPDDELALLPPLSSVAVTTTFPAASAVIAVAAWPLASVV